MDLLEKGLAAKNFGMLGLGDIVVPGECSANESSSMKSTTIYVYSIISCRTLHCTAMPI